MHTYTRKNDLLCRKEMRKSVYGIVSISLSEQDALFNIEAIQIPIVYNKYGDYDPDGLLYVLEEDSQRIQEEAVRRFEMSPPQPYEEVQPLVLRVNLGDTVKICFKNRLNRRLSIHVQGMEYDVDEFDGASVGFNSDSTTDSEILYTWYANTEGVFLFHDMADPRSSEAATNIHGLFGAVIVEPPEASWFSPETGEEIKCGLMADICQPGKPDFREYSVFFHDELEILNADGNTPMDHRTGLPSSTTAINYRSEPMRNRMPLTHDPADSGEEISMSSWVYGDPAPPILRAYVGDPAKIRLIHGGNQGDARVPSSQSSVEAGAGQSSIDNHRFNHDQPAGVLYTGYSVWCRKPKRSNRRRYFSLSSLPPFS